MEFCKMEYYSAGTVKKEGSWLAVVIKWSSIGTKGPNVCQKKISYTIIPHVPVWAIIIRPDGASL